MANELAALTRFTGNLFRHAYFCLSWFCANSPDYRCEVANYDVVAGLLRCLCKNKPLFFGPHEKLVKANQYLIKCYDSLLPDGTPQSNEKALTHYAKAWQYAWKNREHLQLRGHEVRMMKFFHELAAKGDLSHFPELVSMARIVGADVVPLVRAIAPPDGWSAQQALRQARKVLEAHKDTVFGSAEITPEATAAARRKDPDAWKAYQHAQRDYKRAVQLRISEIFDERGWHPTIDSATLHIVLKNEGLEEYLPYTFRGRVGIQPTGYPLTFYTYEGLELEKPPLNDVRMNVNYGVPEKDKDYGIHPVEDGTFYCTSKAVVGDSEVKYYSLEYKRRARRMKYDTVNKLAQSISKVRRRLLRHVQSEDRDTWVRALMCMIIDSKCARIGNTVSARGEKKTYGITTLITKKHVRVSDGHIIIRYRGKHAQPQRHKFKIYDAMPSTVAAQRQAWISKRLMQLIAERNKYLFTRADGKPFTPQAVNDYFTTDKPAPERGLPEGGAAAPCTVHNLRNYHATRIFKESVAKFAQDREAATYEQVLTAYQGRNKTKARRGRKGILDVVADKLGNTPAICRKAYIDPREQLLFFKQWGYRPPDCLIRDVFVHEPTDPYQTEQDHCTRQDVTPCGRGACHICENYLPDVFSQLMEKRQETSRRRQKKLSRS